MSLLDDMVAMFSCLFCQPSEARSCRMHEEVVLRDGALGLLDFWSTEVGSAY